MGILPQPLSAGITCVHHTWLHLSQAELWVQGAQKYMGVPVLSTRPPTPPPAQQHLPCGLIPRLSELLERWPNTVDSGKSSQAAGQRYVMEIAGGRGTTNHAVSWVLLFGGTTLTSTAFCRLGFLQETPLGRSQSGI